MEVARTHNLSFWMSDKGNCGSSAGMAGMKRHFEADDLGSGSNVNGYDHILKRRRECGYQSPEVFPSNPTLFNPNVIHSGLINDHVKRHWDEPEAGVVEQQQRDLKKRRTDGPETPLPVEAVPNVPVMLETPVDDGHVIELEQPVIQMRGRIPDEGSEEIQLKWNVSNEVRSQILTTDNIFPLYPAIASAWNKQSKPASDSWALVLFNSNQPKPLPPRLSPDENKESTDTTEMDL